MPKNQLPKVWMVKIKTKFKKKQGFTKRISSGSTLRKKTVSLIRLLATCMLAKRNLILVFTKMNGYDRI